MLTCKVLACRLRAQYDYDYRMYTHYKKLFDSVQFKRKAIKYERLYRKLTVIVNVVDFLMHACACAYTYISLSGSTSGCTCECFRLLLWCMHVRVYVCMPV
jgi:hypothetical protein